MKDESDCRLPLASSASARHGPARASDASADAGEFFRIMMGIAQSGDGVAKLHETLTARLERVDYAPDALNDVPFLQVGMDAYGELIERLSPTEQEDQAQNFVEGSAAAAIVIDRQQRIVAVNPAAARLFAARQGQEARLEPMDPASSSAISTIFASASAQKSAIAVARIHCNAIPALVEVKSFEHPGAKGMGLVGIRSLSLTWNNDNDNFLAEAFGLTIAERTVCRLIYEGRSLADICEDRNCSISTLRAQLHSIFRKTDTSGQAELVLLLAKLNQRVMQRRSYSKFDWLDPLVREKIMYLPDGRKLAWTWMGDPAGIPVLYLHAGGQGYYFPEPFEQILKQQGIRLIIPSRPGYGNSERDSERDSVEDAVQGLRLLVERECARPFLIVASHRATYFALELADQLGGRVSAILALGDIMRLGRPAREAIGVQSKAFEWLARNAPAVNEATYRASYLKVRNMEFDKTLTFLLGGPRPFDLRHLLADDMQAYARNLVNFCRAQGYRGELEDHSLRIRPFLPLLEKCRVPVHLIAGEFVSHSVMPQSDTEHDRLAAQALARGLIASFERAPGTAMYMCYQNPGYIARRIAHRALECAMGRATGARQTVQMAT